MKFFLEDLVALSGAIGQPSLSSSVPIGPVFRGRNTGADGNFLRLLRLVICGDDDWAGVLVIAFDFLILAALEPSPRDVVVNSYFASMITELHGS